LQRGLHFGALAEAKERAYHLQHHFRVRVMQQAAQERNSIRQAQSPNSGYQLTAHIGIALPLYPLGKKGQQVWIFQSG
jgi:hypothetical protein